MFRERTTGLDVECVITVTLNPAVDRALEVPGFRVGAHARARLKSVLPAGKGVNVARGLVRLGARATACGLVGREELRMFIESLAAEGVGARLCPVAGRTRTNTTVLDPEAHTTTHLREEGFEVREEDLEALSGTLADALADAPGATVVIAGSLPRGMGPARFARFVRECAERGGRVVLDANGPALRAALDTGAVHAVKPNLEELAQCLGRDVGLRDGPEAAQRLLDRVDTVLLTLGGAGAFLLRVGAVVGRRCAVAAGEVRNTVGCGDAFLAGWLRGEQVCDRPADALCWAVAAGAACAMSETTVGYSLADVQLLLRRCEPLERV